MHQPAFHFVQSVLATQRRPKNTDKVVEFGSFNVNGTIRPLFANAKTYVGVDIRPGECVDVVEDAATYGKLGEATIVVCCEMLEHCDHPADVIANARRLLGSDGLFIVTAASPLRAPHGNDGNEVSPDEFYGGVDPDDLVKWLKKSFGNGEVTTNAQAGDVYGWAYNRSGDEFKADQKAAGLAES